MRSLFALVSPLQENRNFICIINVNIHSSTHVVPMESVSMFIFGFQPCHIWFRHLNINIETQISLELLNYVKGISNEQHYFPCYITTLKALGYVFGSATQLCKGYQVQSPHFDFAS